jgi:hypothetical protein
MRRAILSSVAVMLAGAGWTMAQPGSPSAWPPPVPAGAVVPANVPAPPALPPCPPQPCQPFCPPCPTDCCPPPPPPVEEAPYFVCAWVSFEALRWSVKEAPLQVPLVTSSLPNQQGQVGGGIIGEPGTIIVFGGQGIDFDTGNGGRFSCGAYDPNTNLGLEGSVFRLEDLREQFTRGSEDFDNDVVLARPYIDALTNNNQADVVAFPGFLAGGIDVSSSLRFWGANAHVATCVYCENCFSVELLCGFRYYDLKESLVITDRSTIVFAEFEEATRVRRDDFDTRNRFYGGEIGCRSELMLGTFFVNTKTLLAIGANHQSSFISGNTTFFDATGVPVEYEQVGLYALGSNSGRISQDAATVIPSLEVTVGCDIACWLRVFAGYTFIYWGSVPRPGDQIDPVLNPQLFGNSAPLSQLPSPLLPRHPFDRSDFWAQGVSFGLSARF